MIYFRERQAKGETLKTWGTCKDKISCNTCTICLQQNEYSVPCTCGRKKDCICKYCRNVEKVYKYESFESFTFDPVLFESIKHYGFATMHKRIRCMENLSKMAEAKYARLYFTNMYCNPQSKKCALMDVRKLFQKQFKPKLGIKYFIPDPKNGGNSNTGPMATRFFAAPSETASILGISAETVYVLSVCLNMINSKVFQNTSKFEKFANQAFRLLLCDVTNFGDITGTMHTLLVHGSLFIKYAQEELGVAPGDLTENREVLNKHTLCICYKNINKMGGGGCQNG